MADRHVLDVQSGDADRDPHNGPPRVYIMCGLPFSGKSTLARALASRYGWTHLELDRLNTERGIGLDGTVISRQQWTAAYREAFHRLDQLLAAGHTVVYDATNYRWAQREQVRRIASRHSATTMVLHVAVPEAGCRVRLRANRVNRERLDVRDEDFAEVATRFQPPAEHEHVLRYAEQLPLDQWLALMFGKPPVR